MKFEILRHTEYPLRTIGNLAATCYNTTVKDDAHATRIGKHCISSNHGRNLELAQLILKITCSARVGRELYTHIGGMPTRLQSSTRYITYDNFDYYVPEFNDSVIEEEYRNVMNFIKGFYKLMKEHGIDNDKTGYILPLAMETQIIISCNARMLVNMFNQRLCYRTLSEFRLGMRILKKQLSMLDEEWKWIGDRLFVPKCVAERRCVEKKLDCPLYPKYGVDLAKIELVK